MLQKGKVFPVQTMKTHRESGGTAPLILISTLDEGESHVLLIHPN